MKNWGKFFILIMTLLMLSACGEKGGSGGTTTNSTNPYTWDELYEMVGVGENIGVDSANLLDNISDLANLKNSNLITSTDEEEITTLINILNEINLEIISKDSGFNYFTSVSDVETQDSRITDVLKVLSLDDLTALKTELDWLYQNHLSDLTLKSIRTKVEITLNAISSRKGKNPFYSIAPDLFSQYHYNLVENAKFLEDTYSLDISKIDQKKEIQIALETLLEEIEKLNNNNQDLPAKATLENYLDNLRESYVGYINSTSTISKVNDVRLELRLYENGQFSISSSEESVYDSWIQDIKTQLDNKIPVDGAMSTKIEFYKNYISENYTLKMAAYDTQDYSVINSKTVIVLDVIEYLIDNSQDLGVTLNLTLGWAQ